MRLGRTRNAGGVGISAGSRGWTTALLLYLAVDAVLLLSSPYLPPLASWTARLAVLLVGVLALAVGTYPERLEQDLSQLPYLGVLLKDHQDIEDLSGTH